MKDLKDRIKIDGKIDGDKVLVGSFLNHQIDIDLISDMAKNTYNHFKEEKITKVLTIESSGIAIGTMVAKEFGVPLVFAKKNKASTLPPNAYVTEVASFTYQNTYPVYVSSDLINKDDRILIVDDFLAQGNAVYGLIDIINQADASLVGINIAIEKGFQNGGRNLRADGYNVYSLAIIDGYEDGEIIFR